MTESDDFDFISDTDSLNGVRFTIGQSVIPEIIYTVEDDGQDHRVTVSWNEKEHLHFAELERRPASCQNLPMRARTQG